MIKIITKINNKELLKRIFKFLFIDENKNLKLKTLLYVFRYISSERNKKNNLYLLIKFLEENNNINKTSSSKILDFLAKHLINKDSKFYFVNFYKEKNLNKTISGELNNDESEYVEVYDTLNPKSNAKIFKFIMNIFFFSLDESRELDEISNINKILSMLYFNIIPLEEKNIFQILDFLVKYLNSINQQITLQGHKIWQNHFKQYLEILNYTNSYLNIKNNKNQKMEDNYIQKIINAYNKILVILFKLIPNNLSSKDNEILNIIPVIYSYLLTLNNLSSLNKRENNILEKNTYKNEVNISAELLNILNKYLINNKPKNQVSLNSCNISLFYIFYYLKNISKKDYFDIIYSIIIRSLNIDEFKYENTFINSINFILVKLCMKILYEEKEYITKEDDEVLSQYDKKYQFINKLHSVIKKQLKDENNIINTNSINNVDDTILNLNIKQDLSTKLELINKYFNFSSNTNFININMDKYNSNDEIKEMKIEKFKESKDNVNCRYQKWLIFLEMLCKSKSKKAKSNDFNNIDFLLNSSFSFDENKPINFISIIKSLDLDNSDFSAFTNFLSILGNIFINENELVIKKENVFENIIYSFDKNLMHGVVFVLIKKLYEENDIHFNGNFIIFIKPLNLNGIYFVKIQKNSDFKIKNNTAFKLLTQIDQDFNKIFSDTIIFDTNDKRQINYFNNLIEIIFNYSFLEEQISI